MYAIGIDIGGMSIKFGVVDDKGNIIARSRVVTKRDSELAIKDMVTEINGLLSKLNMTINDIEGIGIGCPGSVSSERGEVEYLPNLGWNNVPLRKNLQKSFDVPVKVSNDANVATLAEAKYGCAKGHTNVVMLTLGTGVGGGMIINKQLFEGGWSRGAELGHITLFADGIPCSCGRNGCLECYASATALINQTKEAMKSDKDSTMWDFVKGNIENVDGRTAFECSKSGDKTANKVIDKYVFYLSEGILNFFNIFRPDAFIIGGGISAQGDYLINKIKAYCEKFDYGYKDAPRTEIMAATLGNDAGIIGAAALLR